MDANNQGAAQQAPQRLQVPDFGGSITKMQEWIDTQRGFGATIIQPSELTPISYFRPVVEVVYLCPDDYYKAQGKFRIHFTGLTKLGNTAGVEWIPDETCRTDNRSDKMYVSFRAVGGIRKNDGKIYPMKSEYDLDLEIIEEEVRESYVAKNISQELVEKNTRRDMIQKRKRKLTIAESGAKARVLRAVLGLKSQYDREDQVLGMPFIVVRFVLDHNNADIKNLFLQTARESMLGLYGGGARAALPPVQHIHCSDVIDVPVDDDEAPPEPLTGDEAGEDPRELDFQNSSTEEQDRTILDLCLQTNYDLNGFLKRTQCTLEQLPQGHKMKLYKNLLKLKEAA